jgi:hypothetical protein
VHLVHVQQRTQIGGAALAPHPRHEFGEHERGDELPLVVRQVRRGDHGAAGPTVRSEQHRPDVEMLTHRPRRKRRRCEQTVQPDRQRGAVLRRVELIELEHPELTDRWLLHQADQRGEIQGATVAPRVIDEVGEQDVLPARQRIGSHADQTEQARHVAVDLGGDRLGVGGLSGDVERSDDVDRHSRLRAGRVHGDLGSRPQRRQVVAAETPAVESGTPQFGLFGCVGVDILARRPSLGFVDPRPEVGRCEIREREAQVGQIALRIDCQHRPTGAQHLLDQHDTQTGLARSGHADDHTVGGEVLGAQSDVVTAPAVCGVDQCADTKPVHGA